MATDNKKVDKPKKARRFHPIKFLKDVVGELKKVTWPTRKELLSHTGAVLVFVIGMAIIIGVLDVVFSAGSTALASLSTAAL